MTVEEIPSVTLIRSERVQSLMTELDALVKENCSPDRRLSIYVPTGRQPDEARRSRIHLVNAISTIRQNIENGKDRVPEIENFVNSLESFAREDHEESRDFWNHQLGGLAIFSDKNGSRLIEAAKEFDPSVCLSTHWQLTPLLELAANVDCYWLLSLSQNEVCLYRGSRLGIRKQELPENVPTKFEDSDVAASKSRSDNPDRNSTEADKSALRRFFGEIDRGVMTAIGDDCHAPMILAGVDFYLPIYRQVSHHPHLVDKLISGNAEHRKPDELHEMASAALQSEFLESRKRELLRIRNLAAGDMVMTSLDEILVAAGHGRVKALVAPSDAVCWGRFNGATGAMRKTPADDAEGRDLYQLAAELTLHRGGRLFYLESVKMPGGAKICAELRY